MATEALSFVKACGIATISSRDSNDRLTQKVVRCDDTGGTSIGS
jgi:hypothetical protein